MAALRAEGLDGAYDFAFIDADKAGYDTYYEHCLALVRPGGLILIDNTFHMGQIAEPERWGENAPVVDALNRKIKDGRAGDDGHAAHRRRPHDLPQAGLSRDPLLPGLALLEAPRALRCCSTAGGGRMDAKAEALAAAAAVDEARLWSRQMAMAEIGATEKGGVNRAALSDEDRRARRLMVEWAGELGFEVATDGIANLYVRLPGRQADAAPVVTGSHLDSQPRGGKFDGAYGVIGGFEALEAIARAGVQTERPIDLVAWTNEEGGRFQPGAMGSAVFAGVLSLEDQLGLVDLQGVTLEDALAETLASTPGLAQRPFGHPFAAYVEAHIEQGPRLENAGTTIGAVTGIQGLYWYTVEVRGEEAHAGTTPLKARKDALKAAAHMVHALGGLMADDTDTTRFTVGRFECHPGSPATVPSRVLFTIDFRHPDPAVIARIKPNIEPVCQVSAHGCAVSIRSTIDNAPLQFDPAVIDLVEGYAARLGHSVMRMPSGAGHDAGHINHLCPTGMIFVPCERGISHNEAENAIARRPRRRRPDARRLPGRPRQPGLAMSKRQSEYATFDPEAIDALRPVIRGHKHGIVAGHYLAAQAGFAILEAGGNAIDAGCAAGIALGVVHSDLVNVAGVAPIILYSAKTGQVETISGLGTWPGGDDARPLPARARRAHPGGPAAHRRAQRAGRLDHRAGTPRHHDLRRGGGGGDQARPRRLRDVPADGERDRQEGGELRPLAVQRRDLPAGRPPAGRRRRLRAGRPRTLAPVHGGRGTRRRRAYRHRACRGPRGRARCLLPGRHRRGHRHVPSRERRSAHGRRPRLLPCGGGAARAGLGRRRRRLRLRPVVPGADAAAGAPPDRHEGACGARPQQPGRAAHDGRSAEIGLRGPRALDRRPPLRRRADGGAALGRRTPSGAAPSSGPARRGPRCRRRAIRCRASRLLPARRCGGFG